MVKTLNVEWLLVRDGVVRVFQKLQSSLGFGEWSKKTQKISREQKNTPVIQETEAATCRDSLKLVSIK